MSEQASVGRGMPSSQHGGIERERDLVTELAELARSLQKQPGEDAILAGLVRAALDLVSGTAEGSISVVQGRKNIGSRAPRRKLPAQATRRHVQNFDGAR